MFILLPTIRATVDDTDSISIETISFVPILKMDKAMALLR